MKLSLTFDAPMEFAQLPLFPIALPATDSNLCTPKLVPVRSHLSLSTENALHANSCARHWSTVHASDDN